MSVLGREPSVTTRFANQFKRACEKKNMTDITCELSGQDSKANADAIFSTLDNFVLIEFKSYAEGINKEAIKPRVYKLCHSLLTNKEMEALHRDCHFIMWGVSENNTLQTRYTIYQDSVCRRSVLLNSPILDEPKVPSVLDGGDLSMEIANSSVGLDSDSFFSYLKWLFSEERSSSEEFAGPVLLIATSSNEYIDGLEFTSFDSFQNWAKPVVFKWPEGKKKKNKKKPVKQPFRRR